MYVIRRCLHVLTRHLNSRLDLTVIITRCPTHLDQAVRRKSLWWSSGLTMAACFTLLNSPRSQHSPANGKPATGNKPGRVFLYVFFRDVFFFSSSLTLDINVANRSRRVPAELFTSHVLRVCPESVRKHARSSTRQLSVSSRRSRARDRREVLPWNNDGEHTHTR